MVKNFLKMKIRKSTQYCWNIFDFNKQQKGKRGKILTAKQMLQRLIIALAQVKADNTYENLLNEIGQIMCFLYPVKEIPKKVRNNTISSIKL